MGDWCRVRVVGRCSREDVPALSAALSVSFTDDRWSCLCNGGVCGLPNFAKESFDVVGNLGERGYGPEDVCEHLRQLAKVAPSLEAWVHMGDHHEGATCITTVTLVSGVATAGAPEVETIPEISPGQVQRGMFDQLTRPRL